MGLFVVFVSVQKTAVSNFFFFFFAVFFKNYLIVAFSGVIFNFLQFVLYIFFIWTQNKFRYNKCKVVDFSHV